MSTPPRHGFQSVGPTIPGRKTAPLAKPGMVKQGGPMPGMHRLQWKTEVRAQCSSNEAQHEVLALQWA